MSYCVNCGVELAESERVCPLCQTEVINPRAPWKEPSVMPYPPTLDRLMRRIDRRYLAALLSAFMVLPVVITLLCDWLSGDGALSWSLYVLGAGLLLGVWVIGPLLARRYRLLTFLASDCVAAAGYLLAIERIAGQRWFFPLALPLCAAVSVFLLLNAYLFRKRWGRQVVNRVIAGLSSVGLMCVAVEVTVDLYLTSLIYLNWSPYVLTPCLVMSGVLMLLDGKKNLKEEIRKRMFY